MRERGVAHQPSRNRVRSTTLQWNSRVDFSRGADLLDSNKAAAEFQPHAAGVHPFGPRLDSSGRQSEFRTHHANSSPSPSLHHSTPFWFALRLKISSSPVSTRSFLPHYLHQSTSSPLDFQPQRRRFYPSSSSHISRLAKVYFYGVHVWQ